MPPIKRIALLVLVVVPAIAWFVVKPVRIIAPKLGGLSCPTEYLCIDDLSRSQQAIELYTEARGYVSANVGTLEGTPRFIFCASERCAKYFGLGTRAAVTLGAFGTAVSPRAWEPYYIRHELIHRLQVQHYGTLGILFKPSWFIEGMAYTLSEDPRPQLVEPWESYRSHFRQWYAEGDKSEMWRRADNL